MKTYKAIHTHSITNPEDFWAKQAENIAWFEKPSQVLSQETNGSYRWFSDGKLNTAYLCLDHHVQNGRGEQLALIYDSPVTDTQRKITYAELLDSVKRFAGGLQSLGVNKGDRVVVYMPNMPEAVITMLACARLGAIHSVVFGGFAANELAVRIDDSTPKVVVAASCGIEGSRVIPYKPILDSAIELAEHKPDHCVILQRSQAEASMISVRDIDWVALSEKGLEADCASVNATDPLYILYTSGTTGKPKGVVRDNGGHAVALRYSMESIYDIEPGEVFWAASDVGWVVGHSYIVYAPLLTGATTVIFEGKPVGTPDAGTFWRIISEHQVTAMFTAPTAFRAVRKEDPEAAELARYDISCLERLYMAGERLDPATYDWLVSTVQVPVLDHWWQTETGWAIVGNMAGIEDMPVKAGSATVPVPGYDVQVINSLEQQVPPGEEGRIVIKLPLPPGCLSTLWNAAERYHESYLSEHPGYYLTGDSGYIDEDGYVFIMGRIDDVINVAGHRLSTGEMEEVVGSHPAIAECAVIAVKDTLRGDVPIGFAVLKDGVDISEEALEKDLIQEVRQKIGAFAFFRRLIVVKRLPKTRSGKILRATMRKIASHQAYTVPATIDDPAILDEIAQTMEEHQIGAA